MSFNLRAFALTLSVALLLFCPACDDSSSTSADIIAGDTSLSDTTAAQDGTTADILVDTSPSDVPLQDTPDPDLAPLDTPADVTAQDTAAAEVDTTPDTIAEDLALDVGNTPPTCTITAPLANSEQAYDSEWTFVASATDAEDGDLNGASVEWTGDFATVVLGEGLSLTIVINPGGPHQVTCTATDSDGNTGSDTLEVIALSPFAEIWHPGDGETRDSTLAVPFSGRGRDLEDGALTGASLVWTTTVAGVPTPLAFTGETFNDSLPPGTNVVTLTATDSDGNTHSASITLTMTP